VKPTTAIVVGTGGFARYRGNRIQCRSHVAVFGDQGVLQTGIWGEQLLLRRAADSESAPVPCPPSRGVWDQFLKVRAGRLPNPCPAEIGLRFAQLMDRIRQSDRTRRAARRR